MLHVTTVHRPLDTRIYYKEVRSLFDSGFNVRLATTVDRARTHEGVDFLPLGGREGSRLTRILRDMRAFVTILSHRDAIVHIHDPELLLIAAIPAFCGSRIVYDVHEFYSERIASSKWIPHFLRRGLAGCYELVERLVLPRCAGVVVVSEEMAPRYERFLPRERIALVRNFPNIDGETLRAAAARPHPLAGSPYAIHTGGAMRLRAFHDLVAAAERLRERGSSLVIVNLGDVHLGDYANADDLLARAARAGVVMKGPVDYQEALTWLAHARVGYLPLADTENNRRGMPNKLFEYLLFGLPVVVSDIGRVAKIVADTGAGIAVPVDRGSDHGDAMAELHDDDGAHARFAASSAVASERYSFGGEFEALRALYDRIGSGRVPR